MIVQPRKTVFILLTSLLTTAIDSCCSDTLNIYSDLDTYSDSDTSITGMSQYQESPLTLIAYPTPTHSTQNNPIYALESAGTELPQATVPPAVTAAALMNQNQKNKKIKTVTGTQTDLEKKQKIARIVYRPQAQSQDKKQCPECKNYYKNLKPHMKLHEEKNPALTCDICKYIAVDNSRLQAHIKTHDNSFLVCPQCPGKEFSTPTNLGRHTREKHTKQKLIICDQCGNKFKRLSDKNRHEQIVHNLQLQ